MCVLCLKYGRQREPAAASPPWHIKSWPPREGRGAAPPPPAAPPPRSPSFVLARSPAQEQLPNQVGPVTPLSCKAGSRGHEGRGGGSGKRLHFPRKARVGRELHPSPPADTSCWAPLVPGQPGRSSCVPTRMMTSRALPACGRSGLRLPGSAPVPGKDRAWSMAARNLEDKGRPAVNSVHVASTARPSRPRSHFPMHRNRRGGR